MLKPVFVFFTHLCEGVAQIICDNNLIVLTFVCGNFWRYNSLKWHIEF